MRYLAVLMLVCAAVVGCSRKDDDSKKFSVPDGVTYEYKSSDEVYSFKWGEGDDSAFFVLHPIKHGASGVSVENIASKTQDEIIQSLCDSKDGKSADSPELSETIEMLEEMLNDKSSLTKSSKTGFSTFSAGKFSGLMVNNKVVFSDGKIVYASTYWLPGRKQTWTGILKTTKESDVDIVRQILESSK